MKEYDYKFSVVMAVYNAEDYLAEAVESVTSQDISFKDNVQLILVDDGSQDASGEICDQYAVKFPFNIVVIHKENGGVSSARNEGLKYAAGKYVNFLDGDDKLSKDTLRKVYDFFEKNYDLTDMVSIPLMFFDGRTGEHHLNYKYKNGSRVVDLTTEYNCIQLSASSTFIKSECLKGICFDTRMKYAEDAKVCQIVLLKKLTMGVVSDCCYWYRRHSTGEQSAIQKGELSKEWYIPYLKYFSCDVLQFAQKNVGYIPLFIQFTVMCDLQWRIKTNTKLIKSVLSENEFICFKKRLFEILQYIEDRIILEQRNIWIEHKCYLLSKKYDTLPYYMNCNKDLAICVEHNFIGKESMLSAELSFIKKSGKDFIVEGIVFILDPSDIKKRKIFLSVNNQMIPCETYRVSSRETSCLGDVIMGAVGFTGIIKDYVKYQPLKISLYTDYQGNRVEKKSLKTGNFFPVTSSVANAYAYWNGYILTLKKNCLNIVRSGIIEHIKFEYAFLKCLKRLNTEPARKAILARCVYYVAKRFKRRPLWLISDRINKADDNGEAFFKYLNERRVSETCYFVIRKDSSDYKIVKKYGKVLDHFSKKHKLLHLLADVTISASGDAYVTNPYNRFLKYYQDIISQQKHVFLQHGITQNDLSNWLNRYNKSFDLFVTSAYPEYGSILNGSYCYDENVVKLTGFPRYDRLYDKREKIITIMPTWRDNLSGIGGAGQYARDGLKRYREGFQDTEYYKFYNSLMNDEKLLSKAGKYGYTLQFMPHPNVIIYIDMFTKNESVVFCSVETKYRDIFAKSALIVTDYSSVAFDFAYLRKPVLYCQFDKEQFFSQHIFEQGYFDYERDGFGEVSYDKEALVNHLIEYMKNDCVLKEKYEKRINNFFAFNDRNNCQRVYEAIKEL